MKLSEAMVKGLEEAVYTPDQKFYVSKDGLKADVMGCAALAVGMDARDFRAVLHEGIEDAFVFTLRSEIWYVMHQIWPWLTNDNVNTIGGIESEHGFDAVVAWVKDAEPEVDDQQSPPKPKHAQFIPFINIMQPVLFTQEQCQFIGQALHKAVFHPDYKTVQEVMAGEFEKHCPGFDPSTFYSPKGSNENTSR